ncbi:MAG: RNA-binding transcriptional accessory protein [Gammaproteobacteria bacterium]|nr:RNA-binding transcriptional accessory protein [Gammaproteobacteria bacterium]
MNINQRIATELNVHERQVDATVELLDGGATVPFISRYRKEVTGGLDDAQLRTLEERLRYLRELEERRITVLKSIDEQGKMTAELKQSILAADTKTRLEDLYRPYMQKRRTKAQIAREAGLEPLAHALFADPNLDPDTLAVDYLDADGGVADSKAALEGARHILMEEFAEDAELVGELREFLWDKAKLESKVIEGKEDEGAKFSDYFDFAEPIKAIPSHRALAMFRGRNEGILALNLILDEDRELALGQPSVCERRIAHHVGISDQGRAADKWLKDTVRWTWKVKLYTHLDMELKKVLREAGEVEAIKVFATNLRDLLLSAPAGPRATMGLDPGIRTGVKVAVVDATGKALETATIYPHAPKHQWDQSIATLAKLAEKHQVELIAIGNGTASRETDKLAADLMKLHPQLKLSKVMVNEAGASIYSASEFASREFPDMDVSLRGAVSIARRLQDPLAELVKIEPKSIGVGQYQHDVSQTQLARTLDAIVEDCVNAVGVDINTASAPLLARVSGLNATLAANIVDYRDANGRFSERKHFLKVSRLGEKAFEQCAGFLRIMGGDNPLDASSVHPEAYPVVERIIQQTGHDIKNLIGDSSFLKQLSANDYIDDKFGEPTVKDIIAELDKPGRDPRPEFVTAEFREGVEELKDLKPDMILEGVVTNVTNFGAFVDIGVHQDGLVHISMLADKFVKDPHEVVKTGDVVKVKVLEVDVKRKRVALTMRLTDDSRDHAGGAAPAKEKPRRSSSEKKQGSSAGAGGMGALADAFARAKK